MSDLEAKEKILKSALKEFAELGKQGARMQAIADNASVNKAMLHYYYGGKEKLYEACVVSIFFEMQDVLAKAFSGHEDMESFLDTVATSFLNFHVERPEFIKIFLREILENISNLIEMAKKTEGEQSVLQTFLLVHGEIAKLQMKQIIRSDILPMHIMMTIMGSLASSMVQAQAFSKVSNTDFNIFLEQRKAVLISILKAGLAPQPQAAEK